MSAPVATIAGAWVSGDVRFVPREPQVMSMIRIPVTVDAQAERQPTTARERWLQRIAALIAQADEEGQRTEDPDRVADDDAFTASRKASQRAAIWSS